MKTLKLIINLTVIFIFNFSNNIYSQVVETKPDSVSVSKMEQNNSMFEFINSDSENVTIDHFEMINGIIVLVKNGKIETVEKEITLFNGSKCLPAGYCVSKDGKKTFLKEGEKMDMEGKIFGDFKSLEKIDMEK